MKRTVPANHCWAIVLTLAIVMICGCNSQSGQFGSKGIASKGSTISASITAGGSTFVKPLMMKWIKIYGAAHPNVSINYQGIGSGAGISQYSAGTIDFGASDAPVTDKELGRIGKPTIQLPLACGCVVISYNIPGITKPLRLSGDVIAGIYLGEITKWNDPKITRENPNLLLPDIGIVPVHRADASGTTYIFTSYLCAENSIWNEQIGTNKSVNWPLVGMAAIQNQGVAQAIKLTPGAIGYIDLALSVQAKMPAAAIQNQDGIYLMPSISGTSSAENASIDLLKKDVRLPIVNAPGKDSYPICGFTYALIQSNMKDKNQAREIQTFLTYCVSEGQQVGISLQYAPLPRSISQLDINLLKGTSKAPSK